MLNHIVIMGRLTRDPELRYTQSNTPVTSFRVAVDRDFAPRDGGERQTDFIDCVAWRASAEFVSKYFQKGSMAVVSGRLQMREWTDKEGNRRTTAEVVADNVYFGDSKRDGDNGSYNGNSYAGNNGGGYAGSNAYAGNNAGYAGNNGGYAGGNGGRSYNDGGYPAPAAPTAPAASDFAMLEDDDSELPF